MKNQKGITLIALVVTIIVLLILAGISIAMLTGKNGIITNAGKAATANAYYGAEEQVKLEYMAVRTEIMAKSVADGTYDPTTAANTTALAAIVSKDLSTSEWAVDGSTPGVIAITYTNSAIDAGVIDTNVPRNEGHINYTITLSASQTASLELDIAD